LRKPLQIAEKSNEFTFVYGFSGMVGLISTAKRAGTKVQAPSSRQRGQAPTESLGTSNTSIYPRDNGRAPGGRNARHGARHDCAVEGMTIADEADGMNSAREDPEMALVFQARATGADTGAVIPLVRRMAG
jgi:hypothetical protein